MFKRITTKSVIVATFFLLTGTLSYFIYDRVYKPKAAVLSNSTVRETTAEVSIFEEIKKPILGKPTRLVIESVGIDREIVMVGTDSGGFMATPDDFMHLGWYKKSHKTGDTGNIIINGHYDDSSGKPAAFWQLKNVVKDAKLLLVDEYGRHYTYTVTDVYYVAIDDPDRFKIFDFTEGKKTMTLITCGGVWLPHESTYNKRLIVRAEVMAE